MRTISRRLEKLEKTFPFQVEKVDDKGAARIRAWIRGLAKPVAAQLEKFLKEVGPERFHTELMRAELIANGFVQGPDESLAATMARAAGITGPQLRARLCEGRSGMAFVYEQIRLRGVHGQPGQAAGLSTDNG